jgi:hypothetical protein
LPQAASPQAYDRRPLPAQRDRCRLERDEGPPRSAAEKSIGARVYVPLVGYLD